ncbi:hypothetical protein A3G55_03610 [Candidatus Giovannonibacteria bacterium RIFCSPLOWO2_12_FULL_44_25]|uniref:UDP-N-acetylmuramoyl-tripeptide-D-alanyl-D-alanine ligase n=3 Tax=Parcubacteria group TaxID=1794811 RepID=A0A837IGI2_9BACT|nr:MAG: UDP-N-acetylmuramoylalanyl-D-glutamyl-2,6-diaminopimelate-D-alanyl-D-alanyl ligase, UDP-N-acetylmuramoylalanyl-D-glutamyl-2,6-diaminopimelate-D-alanyl-D-alanine ligase [Parcubacteria group bacterium GW2011_GWC1_44_10]KKT59751.1 MAG: UDP-N-acetylmuramoyl-tripeptide-D-alanyl-D-alanine ligase [Candidatus Giovannonibacteria bacterium GW2011_GWA1_44_25]KKU12284.1 MAG: UDP-N-acetylmuramoyl-tripeptide-D-alanyl-D-alanine ligase [Candidatus Azambacteria bacterium GW2011_GWC2_45_7b]KKU29629.1 MAG:
MRVIIKNLITRVLVWEAKMALRRHGPQIIGITGSVGKSSAKEAVFAVLEQKFNVRKGLKSYNSELGLSLAVLGLETRWLNPIGWLNNIYLGFKEIFKEFPKILILEMGVDRPGDLDKLLKIARPDIAIVTAVGEIPVHVEFFAGAEEVAKEKAKILKSLPANGKAILNYDDETVWAMKEKTNAEVLGFGFASGADVVASNYQISENGISFKIEHNGSTVPIRLKNVFGKQAVYASLAAAAAGLVHSMNLIEISGALQKYQPPPGRLRLIQGIKNSFILDDSYNASPLAVHAALDTLKDFAGKRKMVVFGDMLEIGKFTILAHKAVGERVASFADYFVTVGPRAKFSAEEAVSRGMPKERVKSFSTTKEAAGYIKNIMQEGDLILVKGSQAMRMERIVEEIMATPEDAPKLLARQDKFWKDKE